MQVEPIQEETQHVASIPEVGAPFAVEAGHLHPGAGDIVSNIFPFTDVTDSIESIANSIINTLKKVKPHRASVEFGVEIVIDSGKLIAAIAKGEGKANMKIMLEWGEELPPLTNDDGVSGDPASE